LQAIFFLQGRSDGTSVQDLASKIKGAKEPQTIGRALAAIGRSFDEFNDVLERGCGCGRILRHLPRPPAAPKRLYAFDIDPEGLSWVNEYLPWVETSRTDGLPSLPYADGTFDLIFNHSVMAHLDVAYQDAWLGELRRALKPRGIATLTVSGKNAFGKFLETLPSDAHF
jgi:SAM-dependent methyltransferase